MKTNDTRTLSPSAQEALRMRAVKAALKAGTQKEVCQIFGISRQSLNNWLKKYRKGGLKALKAQKRGRKSSIRLKPWQSATIVRLITEKLPDQLKLPFALWTREAVEQLIELKFDIKLSKMTVGRYLKRWGFTPQKPAKRAIEQSPEAVKRWLETEYPAIKARALKEKAEIHWGDETGIRSDHQAGRTYGRKGKTPVVPSTGQRFGCGVISTITNRGSLRFMVLQKRFNASQFLKMLNRLIKSVKIDKVFLIVDNHPVHRAKKVKRWLEKHIAKIEIFYLPPYSPEVNPDEYLNNDLKSNAVGRKRAKDPEELVNNVRKFLKSQQKKSSEVKKYFQAKSVKYASI
jgi:transposase